MQVIQQAKQMCQNSQYGPGAIAFEFAQVRLHTIKAHLMTVQSFLHIT